MSSLSRIDVSSWFFYLDEPGGVTKKHWIEHPNDGSKWLYKAVRIHSNQNRTTSDLSEVVAYRIASALEIPTAEYQLALRNGEEGVISRDVKLPGYELEEGWKWLRRHYSSLMPSMNRRTYDSPDKQQSDYKYENLKQCLPELSPSLGFEWTGDGYTLFCGYLLLDALIANTDRHEANWSVLVSPESSGIPNMLAPTFDHGSSLGHQLMDSKKEALLENPPELRSWCERGKASKFAKTSEGVTLSLVDYFIEAAQHADETVIPKWIKIIDSELTDDKIDDLLPLSFTASPIGLDFAKAVLRENVRRLLGRVE